MIKIIAENEAIKSVMNEGEIKGLTKNLLIGSREGNPSMALRVMELEEGGYTPFHEHQWEHINYVLDGEGIIKTEQGDKKLQKGSAVLVPAGEKHQYLNGGKEKFRFICLVPVERE
ncbi:cupin domain-containing protein [candidate division WOR-3 bacterium]|nr:cupin domain-containing protein [candidate division WOR-3 bacterium]